MCYNATENCIYYGPTLRYDLYIDSEANEKRISFTYLRFAYDISPRQTKFLLTGSKYFKVS